MSRRTPPPETQAVGSESGTSALKKLYIGREMWVLMTFMAGKSDVSELQEKLLCCNAMAGGVLLAAALVHLLPDAQQGLQEVSIELHQWVRPSAVPGSHVSHLGPTRMSHSPWPVPWWALPSLASWRLRP